MDWLDDIIGHCDVAARLVGQGKQAYDDSEWAQLAAEAILIRAGEGVARIDGADPGFADAHPGLELRSLKNTRNLVAHGYDIVAPEMVWEILADRLPVVRARIADLLAQVG